MASAICIEHFRDVPGVQIGDFTIRHLEMLLWVHVGGVDAAHVSQLPYESNVCPVHELSRNEESGMSVALTNRDLEFIRILDRARWLTTSQVQQHYFRNASINACQKRLRKLAEADLIAHARPSRTEQNLWRIGSRAVARLHSEGIAIQGIPKRPPGNLEHFLTINSFRLWFMRHFENRNDYRLDSFLGEWELKEGRQLQVIPDALVSIEMASRRSLICNEVDLGTENPTFFKRSKLHNYSQLVSRGEMPPVVLILVPDRRRLVALVRQLYGHSVAQYFFIAEIQPLLAADPHAALLISLSNDGAASIRRSKRCS